MYVKEGSYKFGYTDMAWAAVQKELNMSEMKQIWSLTLCNNRKHVNGWKLVMNNVFWPDFKILMWFLKLIKNFEHIDYGQLWNIIAHKGFPPYLAFYIVI